LGKRGKKTCKLLVKKRSRGQIRKAQIVGQKEQGDGINPKGGKRTDNRLFNKVLGKAHAEDGAAERGRKEGINRGEEQTLSPPGKRGEREENGGEKEERTRHGPIVFVKVYARRFKKKKGKRGQNPTPGRG